MLIPSRGDGLLTTAEAAYVAGVRPSTIRTWVRRGRITADGLDEQGNPLYRRDTVTAAEKQVTENGLKASGINPRQLRHHHRKAA